MNEQVQCVAEIAAEPNDLLVAFASSDGDMVDEHFGSAAAFYVHRVRAAGSEAVASQRFGQEKRDGNEDKLKPKLAWLVGCDIVYCGSIGGSASRQLIALDISPVQVAEGPDVADLVEELQSQLAGTPERWLENILKRKAKRGSGGFTVDAEEEWAE
ncbi:NifB/NifX family molybdenum-iron cluster-binding protein [Stutzerimonas tarimensis]|uniref:NifB/NifX family molybdenum-iron cluster-binding protein n=1 Tax=Stutzerimonas tarimensis TaxID=1507735 RepID=A0ABV7T037_9GAMM